MFSCSPSTQQILKTEAKTLCHQYRHAMEKIGKDKSKRDKYLKKIKELETSVSESAKKLCCKILQYEGKNTLHLLNLENNFMIENVYYMHLNYKGHYEFRNHISEISIFSDTFFSLKEIYNNMCSYENIFSTLVFFLKTINY